MKNLLILTALVSLLGIPCLGADAKPLFAPRPTKDPMASKKHSQGAGIFVVDKECRAYVDAAIPEIFKTWNEKELLDSS